MNILFRFFEEISDRLLLLITIIISCVGLVVLYSASNGDNNILTQQIVRLLFAISLMLIISRANIHIIRMISPYIYVGVILMLLLVLFLGQGRGASRWLVFFDISFQPSELLKISIPMMLAWYLSQSEEKEINIINLFISFLIIFIPVIFVVRQPDLALSLIAIFCGFITLVLATLNLRYILTLLVIAISSIPLLWKYFLLPYQKARIITLFDPETDALGSGYHIIQSKIAVGSGGFFGKGLMNGTQSQLEFLPERSTDFIFAVFSEEFGFLGVLILFLLYAILIFRGISIVTKAKTYYGKILGGSIVIIFFMLVLINVAMSTGIIPVAGVTLPLVSQGGSSLISFFVSLGILLAIGRKQSGTK